MPKPNFSYSEMMFDFIVLAVGTFLFAWLNLPGFRWVVVGGGIALVITARLLRR